MARRLTEPGSDLSAPCVVERTFGWLHHFQRLLGRDRRAEIHEAFLALGC